MVLPIRTRQKRGRKTEGGHNRKGLLQLEFIKVNEVQNTKEVRGSEKVVEWEISVTRKHCSQSTRGVDPQSQGMVVRVKYSYVTERVEKTWSTRV